MKSDLKVQKKFHKNPSVKRYYNILDASLVVKKTLWGFINCSCYHFGEQKTQHILEKLYPFTEENKNAFKRKQPFLSFKQGLGLLKLV